MVFTLNHMQKYQLKSVAIYQQLFKVNISVKALTQVYPHKYIKDIFL